MIIISCYTMQSLYEYNCIKTVKSQFKTGKKIIFKYTIRLLDEVCAAVCVKILKMVSNIHIII